MKMIKVKSQCGIGKVWDWSDLCWSACIESLGPRGCCKITFDWCDQGSTLKNWNLVQIWSQVDYDQSKDPDNRKYPKRLASVKKWWHIYELTDKEMVYVAFNAVVGTVSDFIGNRLVVNPQLRHESPTPQGVLEEVRSNAAIQAQLADLCLEALQNGKLSRRMLNWSNGKRLLEELGCSDMNSMSLPLARYRLICWTCGYEGHGAVSCSTKWGLPLDFEDECTMCRRHKD